MTNLATLAARHARRPLLLTPDAARELASRIYAVDDRAFSRPGLFRVALRALGMNGRRPAAQDHCDDEIEDREAAHAVRGPSCYSPLWAQQAYGEPQDEGFGWSLYNGVALIEIKGPLYARGEYFCGEWYHGYDTLLAAHREAVADDRVKAVFTVHNSPGGVVAPGLSELAAFVRNNRQAAGGKPMWAYVDMACSADYYVAAQYDRVSGAPVSLVGSIGAVLVLEDWSEAYAKAGVKVNEIIFGSKKTDGADWKELSEAARADLQAEIDQCGRDFVADVALGRPKLTAEALIATQAAVFMAKHDDPARSGLALGFVDAIETEEEAFMALLAHIAPQVSAPAIRTPTGLAAKGSRGGLSPKETSAMAANGPKTTPLLIAGASAGGLLANIDRVSADLDRIRASLAAPEGGEAPEAAQAPAATAESDPCPGCDGSGEVDGSECPECGGTGIDPDAGPGAEADGELVEASAAAAAPEGDASAARAAVEREAILASAEAKEHPHAALAAIRDGLTLAQFRGQLEAHANAPRGQLGRLLKGSPRVGPDASRTAGGMGSALVADARAQADKAAAGRK